VKVCVYGAGAIGGHLAARLAQGGAEVSVVARGAALAAIRAGGLRVTTPVDRLALRVAASDDPAELGEQDAVVVTVKTPSLPSVAAGIAPLLRPDTPVVFVLNGIPWWYSDELPELDPDGALHRAVGISRSLGGVIYSACTVTAPGEIHVEHARNRIVLGEIDGAISPRVEALAAVLRAGGIGAEVTADIRKAVWAKLLVNLGSAPVAVITGLAVRDNIAEPAIEAAVREIYREAGTIAQFLGSPVAFDVETAIANARGLAHKPSILQDLERGSAMETLTMFEAPLRLARLAGVATPTLDLIVALARLRVKAARG
jgi:2-dehydropantoate 2-reductase